jgi:hypothetical protein
VSVEEDSPSLGVDSTVVPSNYMSLSRNFAGLNLQRGSTTTRPLYTEPILISPEISTDSDQTIR